MQLPDLADPADVTRLVAGLLGLVLAVTCCGSLAYARGWAHRVRFLALLGYAVILIGAQLDALGKPPTWRTFAAIPVGILAVVGTAAFLVDHVRNTERGTSARRSDDQRRVLRAGAPARRADRRHRRTRAPGGNPS